MPQARGHGLTDTGVVRDHNEDALLVDNDLQLYVVADGMGGHKGGEIASAEAVRSVREHVERAGNAPLEEIVEKAIQHACRNVFELSQTDQGKPGMGCTVTLLMTRGDKGVVGHAGDSRLYRFRGGEVGQVTRDHSMVQRLFERGKISAEEAKDHPLSHVLVNAVGLDADCDVDVLPLELSAGDRFLLCSDGLSNYFAEASGLTSYLEGDAIEEVTAALIAHAIESGAEDNVTALVVEIEGAVPRPVASSPLLGLLEELPGARTQSVPAGEVVISAGDASASWWAVLSGSLLVSRWNADLRRLGAGDALGATSLVAPRASRVTVRAEAATELVVVDRHTFDVLSAEERNEVLQAIIRYQGFVARRAGILDV